MTRYFIILLLALLAGGNTKTYGGNPAASSPVTHQTDNAGNHAAGAKTPLHAEKAHLHVPSWDELAHIHHFHKDRMKKMKRHYRKSVFLTRLFLFVVHAAILFISYLHVTH